MNLSYVGHFPTYVQLLHFVQVLNHLFDRITSYNVCYTKLLRIPTANRSASVGDNVIINYLYNASLIIAPSKDAFTQTRNKYADINFLHSDMFGARLKIDEEPLPSKQTILV